jgi:hypothetical protein
MSSQPGKSGFQLDLDPKAAEAFLKHLKDEGLMQAGFVIHESNNLTINVQEKSAPPQAGNQGAKS